MHTIWRSKFQNVEKLHEGLTICSTIQTRVGVLQKIEFERTQKAVCSAVGKWRFWETGSGKLGVTVEACCLLCVWSPQPCCHCMWRSPHPLFDRFLVGFDFCLCFRILRCMCGFGWIGCHFFGSWQNEGKEGVWNSEYSVLSFLFSTFFNNFCFLILSITCWFRINFDRFYSNSW